MTVLGLASTYNGSRSLWFIMHNGRRCTGEDTGVNLGVLSLGVLRDAREVYDCVDHHIVVLAKNTIIMHYNLRSNPVTNYLRRRA